MKICYRCKEEKSLSGFFSDRSKKDGLSSRCKECDRVVAKEYRLRSPRKIKDINKNSYNRQKENPDFNKNRYRKSREKNIQRSSDSRKTIETKLRTLLNSCKRRGKDVDIDFLYLLSLYVRQDMRCALSKLPLWKNFGGTGRKYRPMSISLDRVDSSRGYIKGNVRLVLTAVNIGLNAFGDDIYKAICHAVAQNDSEATQAGDLWMVCC